MGEKYGRKYGKRDRGKEIEGKETDGKETEGKDIRKERSGTGHSQ
jgi:hypothetical protein